MPVEHNVLQNSEAWESLRRGRITASQFDRVITPAKLQFASGAMTYACELVAERLGVQSPPPPPSFWMDYGKEAEQYAKQEFAEMIGCELRDVGFVTPDDGLLYGASPDSMVGTYGVLECKCPKAETLIAYHAAGILPNEYKLQVQGQLWVTERDVAHFYAWHPELTPFHVVVERDEIVIKALEDGVLRLLEIVDDLASKIQKRENKFVFAGSDLEGFDDGDY